MQLSLDPDVADLAPTDPALTRYDEEHLVTYLRMLDANAEAQSAQRFSRKSCAIMNLKRDVIQPNPIALVSCHELRPC